MTADEKELVRELRAVCGEPETMALCRNAADRIERKDAEYAPFRNAASQYGITAPVMLELAKSQIKTCADNIRMMERLRDVYEKVYAEIPEETTGHDLVAALYEYDGDGSKSACDLVFAGLKIIQEFLGERDEAQRWLSKYAI